MDATGVISGVHCDRGLWWCGDGAMVGDLAISDIYQSTGVAGMFWMAVVAVVMTAIVCGGVFALGAIAIGSAMHQAVEHA